MHHASENISAIASALAKAQMEISNPEKSMVGSILYQRDSAPKSFRYAPLSSGLEIIRKTLGRQQIAVTQVTAIDGLNKIVNLTTILLHSSGEWISSDWPVCSLSETSSPRRMGAALTYARRYALFTLVGIAGEDDLDGPDFQATNTFEPMSDTSNVLANSKHSLDPGKSLTGNGIGRRDEPATLPDLLRDIERLSSLDQLHARAGDLLEGKNLLSSEDAKVIERAFAAKLSDLEARGSESGSGSAPDFRTPIIGAETSDEMQSANSRPTRNVRISKPRKPTTVKHTSATAQRQLKAGKGSRDKGARHIDKSALTHSEPRRYRDKDHLKYVASQPCLVCGRTPVDAHHLRFAQVRAMGRKASDEFTIPLCRTHHREIHTFGDEQAWWAKTSIDPIEVARQLWSTTRGT